MYNWCSVFSTLYARYSPSSMICLLPPLFVFYLQFAGHPGFGQMLTDIDIALLKEVEAVTVDVVSESYNSFKVSFVRIPSRFVSVAPVSLASRLSEYRKYGSLVCACNSVLFVHCSLVALLTHIFSISQPSSYPGYHPLDCESLQQRR